MTHHNSKKNAAGFALLITIITLTVVISVTLAIVELSLKQLELSVSSTDSELAFQAANAGIECARYVRNHAANDTDFETGQSVTFDCMGSSPTANPNHPGSTGAGDVYVYSTELDWGTAPQQRCSHIEMVTMVAGDTGSDLEYAGIQSIIPAYPSGTKTCELGGRCTVVSVTGYSSNCATKNAVSTLKRELLIEF